MIDPLYRILTDAARAELRRKLPRILAANPCTGRIHDDDAQKVAFTNAMYTATHDENDGSYQHLCMGGQGRDDAEIESWGETLHTACTIFGVGVVVAVVMFVAACVVKGVV